MNHTLRFFITSLVALVTIVALMWISTWQSISINKVEIAKGSEAYTPTTLPLSLDYVGDYKVRIEIAGISAAQHSFRIYPDDEIHALSVNGEAISLEHLSSEQKRDYAAGFVIALEKLSPQTPNIFEASLTNASNPAGFRIESTERLSASKLAIIYIILLGFSLYLTRHLKITRSQMLLLALSLALSTLYLSKTDERTRTFDVFEGGGHKDYIEYLIDNHELPMPGDGWEYHQPPLYYLTAALAKQSAPINSKLTGELWGQLLALVLWSLFLLSSLASLRSAFCNSHLALLLASTALCLWPAGIIHSIRIGNDLGLYACYGLSFFYTIKWWKNRSSRTLFWASLWMAASLLSKSNGLAVAGILGILMLLHIYSFTKKPARLAANKQKLIRDAVIASGFFLSAIVLNFADNVHNYLKGTSEDWLLSNVSSMINAGLKVSNRPQNYLIFDSATFIEQPFISTWDDKYGRQYFWNFVMRSALSSEYFFNGEKMQFWGLVNGILLLLMLIGLFVFVLQRQAQMNSQQIKRYTYRNAPWLMALIFPFILLLAYRIKVPLSCNTDFRYIYPVLIAILFFTLGSWRLKGQLITPKLLTLAAPLIGINSLLWIYLLL
jgi:hypothetical protein